MGLRPCRFARRSGSGVPLITAMPYTTGQTFILGALLVATGAGPGTVSECAADPTEVNGVALQGAGTNPGYDAANSPTVVTGRNQEVSAIVADLETVFAIDGSADAGATQQTPAVTDINVSYGVAKDANGIWYLDTTEVTTKVFNVVDIDIDNKIFYVKFLQAVIATAT